jgi:hypothetical protein
VADPAKADVSYSSAITTVNEFGTYFNHKMLGLVFHKTLCYIYEVGGREPTSVEVAWHLRLASV